jgi:hypothetical protein
VVQLNRVVRYKSADEKLKFTNESLDAFLLQVANTSCLKKYLLSAYIGASEASDTIQ